MATSNEAVGRTEEPAREEEDVIQIKTVPFKSSCLNSITVSGIIVDDPRQSQPKENLIITEMNVAVPKPNKFPNEIVYEQFMLTFFNFSAKQAAQFVKKGSTLVAQGRLRVFRNNPSIVVDEFALLEEGTWPYGDAPPIIDSSQSQGWQSSRDTSGPRTIMEPSLRPSMERVYGDHENGMSVDDIATQRGIKKTTVLGYLAQNAYCGKRMNYEWLTRQCLLGPRGAQYMEIDDVASAIEVTAKKHQLTVLGEVPLVEARDLLKHVKDGVPFNNSEETINAVTYCQIKVVAAMLKNGMTARDWNSFRVAEIPFSPPSIQEQTFSHKSEAPF